MGFWGPRAENFGAFDGAQDTKTAKISQAIRFFELGCLGAEQAWPPTQV